MPKRIDQVAKLSLLLALGMALLGLYLQYGLGLAFWGGMVLAFGEAALVGGLADSTVLSRSQVPFALSTGLARLIVAASLGMGIGVAVASALAIRKLEPRVVGADDD